MSQLPRLSADQCDRPGIVGWRGRSVEVVWANEPRARPDAAFVIELPRPPRSHLRLGIRVGSVISPSQAQPAASDNNYDPSTVPQPQPADQAHESENGSSGLNVGTPPGVSTQTPEVTIENITLEVFANVLEQIAVLPPIDQTADVYIEQVEANEDEYVDVEN
ncbi:hypothetical protein FRC09_006542 [Ceratobasidium sp. 395]|nr:hypothetical protein FRC09_006542 [Ceratobasidium sp. 395]